MNWIFATLGKLFEGAGSLSRKIGRKFNSWWK